MDDSQQRLFEPSSEDASAENTTDASTAAQSDRGVASPTVFSSDDPMPDEETVQEAVGQLDYSAESATESIGTEGDSFRHYSPIAESRRKTATENDTPILIGTVSLTSKSTLTETLYRYNLTIHTVNVPCDQPRTRFQSTEGIHSSTPRRERLIKTLIDQFAPRLATPFGEGFRQIPAENIHLIIPKAVFKRHPSPTDLATLVSTINSFEDHTPTDEQRSLLDAYTTAKQTASEASQEIRHIKRAAKAAFDISTTSTSLPEPYAEASVAELQSRLETATDREATAQTRIQDVGEDLQTTLASTTHFARRLLPDTYTGPLPETLADETS